MSVHKRDRNESKFEVMDHAIVLKKMIRELSIVRNFGFKVRESKTPKNYEQWSDVSKERWQAKEAERLERLKELDSGFLMEKRKVIDSDLTDLTHSIRSANAIKYPVSLSEADKRRGFQDDAIAACEHLMDDLQDIMDTLPIDKNWMTKIQPEIDREIALITAWRKSDNPKRRALREQDMKRWLTFIETNGTNEAVIAFFHSFSEAMERCEPDNPSESIWP